MFRTRADSLQKGQFQFFPSFLWLLNLKAIHHFIVSFNFNTWPDTCCDLSQACNAIEEGYNPGITFIVAQKRHNTRFFPSNPQSRDILPKNGNVLPGNSSLLWQWYCFTFYAFEVYKGSKKCFCNRSWVSKSCLHDKMFWGYAGTIVDKDVCHPHNYDFFLISHAGLIVYFYKHSFPVVYLWYYIRKEILLIAESGVTANLLFNFFILKCKWKLTVLMWFYLSAGNCPPDTLPCTLQREQAWAWWHPATHKPLVLHVGYWSFLPCVVCIPISFQRV